jgi:hypothetical protein
VVVRGGRAAARALAALGRSGELPRWRGRDMAGLLADDPALAEAVAAEATR